MGNLLLVSPNSAKIVLDLLKYAHYAPHLLEITCIYSVLGPHLLVFHCFHADLGADLVVLNPFHLDFKKTCNYF